MSETTCVTTLREELKKRGIWHKHHVEVHGDQYYQLGETQQYSPNFEGRGFSKEGQL